MNTKCIFLLIFSLTFEYNSTTRLNEPELDEEQVQMDKRSAEDEHCSDDFFVTNIKKDLTDVDYRTDNVEPDIDDRETEDSKEIRKRETEVLSDIQSFSDADIEQALSKLSEGELQVLEKVMENEAPAVNLKKRGIMENHSGKICDSRYGCVRRNSDDLDDRNYKQVITYEQLPDERHKSSKMFKRFSRFSPLSREEIMQARIDFLKDNYKRQSEIGKIENSFKRKERYQRDAAKEGMRNPYFNSLIGPRSRTKRSTESKPLAVNPMDDPKSSEHLKLLEESFPNPNLDNSLHSDQPHIRVKRA